MSTLLTKDTQIYVMAADGAHTENLTGRAAPSMPGLECDINTRSLVGQNEEHHRVTLLRTTYELAGILKDSPTNALEQVFRSDGQVFRSLTTVGDKLFVMGDFVCTAPPVSADDGIYTLSASTSPRGSLLIAEGLIPKTGNDGPTSFVSAGMTIEANQEFAALIWKTAGGQTVDDGYTIRFSFDPPVGGPYTADLVIPTGSFSGSADFYLWRGILRDASQNPVPAGSTGDLIVGSSPRGGDGDYDPFAAPNLFATATILTIGD